VMYSVYWLIALRRLRSFAAAEVTR
jgi:hypothetical protein